jgi:pimeloyl-ACP methyl ester carboxylesterase
MVVGGGEPRQELVRPTAVVSLAAGPVEYRWEQRGDAVVVVFHGGHVRAGLALCEEVFAAADCTVLAPSRPGYGRTPVTTGTSVEQYTDVVRALCDRLGIARVAAVVGISGGGPTAATMAARHGDLVERLILVSAVGWLPYPDRWTRLGAHIVFTGLTERMAWAGVRVVARVAPTPFLRLMLRSLSTRPAGEVLARLSTADRVLLLSLFTQMRSGQGFLNDLRPTPDITAGISQPTLVIATRTDRGVPFDHAQSLSRSIRHAELVESQADSHLVWLGSDWPAIAERIRDFLHADPPPVSARHPQVPVSTTASAPEARAASSLTRAFHRPLRAATAALALTGALLAAITAVPAFARLGTGAGLGFLAVAAAGIGLAIAVRRGARWALAIAAAGLGGQLAAVIGTAWELIGGISAQKAHTLHRLGLSPTVGLLVNLVYSSVAVALFCWLAHRWLNQRRELCPDLRNPA